MSIVKVGERCCGCRTCEMVCPVDAISFHYDNMGFEMPIVDDSKCIECNKCVKVCPELNNFDTTTALLCGAAYSLDANIKFMGSSGGLFGTIAQKIINEGGVVYGAAFDNNLQLKTNRVESVDELIPLYKSKYLLCNTDNKFSDIKKDLKSGRRVLYCSSPCQIHALKLYLGRDYENLITLDFVCHGVGSQKLWDESIKYLEKKHGIKILAYQMRYKPNKPSSHYYYYLYRDLNSGREKQKVNIYLKDPYYHAYQRRLLCRDSCYDCKFATSNRLGDITIADFHNILKYNSKIDRFAGVSMFVCNTERGKQLFDTIKQQLYVEEFDWNILKRENRFENSEKKSKKAVDFLTLANTSFTKAVDKYLNPYKNYTFYYYLMPKFIRDLARKIFIK